MLMMNPDLGMPFGLMQEVEQCMTHNTEEFEVKCSCRHFQFRGIICRHILCVLTHKKIKQVPSQYICDRWRKMQKENITLSVAYMAAWKTLLLQIVLTSYAIFSSQL